MTNPEQELAFRYLAETNRHLFLTGKAGTGKTTFLHRVRREIPKRLAVVAPTGVAAINAKGVTIHSLFQLPFGTLTPERLNAEIKTRRFSTKKRDLILSLDMLIIDEISMVRADVLDGIDAVLRYLRRTSVPFGGVQLFMIGDLHQLPPVVKDHDWYEMRDYYKTAYFFGSLALRQTPTRIIQLTHIYRQQDEVFIELLNKVRNNNMDRQVLGQLNARFIPDFEPPAEEGYVTLTSHNKDSDAINLAQLSRLSTRAHAFKARIDGEFPESMYPNEPELTFKVGAQVMFNKNDMGEARAYYNGKLGTITAIEDDEITVVSDGDELTIVPVQWENRRYSLNKNKEVEEDTIGTYEQHPLRLAWAITIHKSQGLTFDRVVIDAGAAFAHGQVYVALSRCRTFEGIVLRTRIGNEAVRTDEIVSAYSAHAAANAPDEDSLLADRRAFEIACLKELFTFKETAFAAARLTKALLEHDRSYQGTAKADFAELRVGLEEQLVAVGHGFIGHLQRYGKDEYLPSKHPELSGRLEKARGYFTELLTDKFLPELAVFGVMTDNQSVKMQIDERRQDLLRELFVKLQLFKALTGGFDARAFVKARADAAIDFEQEQKKQASKPKPVALPKNIEHPDLYHRLAEWRNEQATDAGVPAYTVARNATLLEIATELPNNKANLLRIGGVGMKTWEKYGAAILEIVEGYLDGREGPKDLFS